MTLKVVDPMPMTTLLADIVDLYIARIIMCANYALLFSNLVQLLTVVTGRCTLYLKTVDISAGVLR